MADFMVGIMLQRQKNFLDHKWYKYNDATVNELTGGAVSPNAYLLFYQRKKSTTVNLVAGKTPSSPSKVMEPTLSETGGDGTNQEMPLRKASSFEIKEPKLK